MADAVKPAVFNAERQNFVKRIYDEKYIEAVLADYGYVFFIK